MSILRRFLVCITAFLTFTLPPVAALRYWTPSMTSLMWQRRRPVVQTWVPLKDIAPSLKEMVIAAEDANFYRHHGVDFREMEASWKKNKRKKKYARGFSTITMQLARNLYLTPHKNIVRKGLEILIALEMEVLLPKDRILELYLNLIEWGDGVYGAEAAAEHYFSRPAKSLAPSQSAFLAAIVPNPRRWGRWPAGPYVSKRMDILQIRAGFGRDHATAPPELPEIPAEDESSGTGPGPETEP